MWAEKKCGMLKSEIFESCHGEVPVEKYMKRCVYDACACDQGGDCECLCTALAAYAHSCTMKGVPIRWRTPDLCRKYQVFGPDEQASVRLIGFFFTFSNAM